MKLKNLEDCKDLEEVRQVAIKWIKEYEFQCGFCKDALMELHNITEEDLK